MAYHLPPPSGRSPASRNPLNTVTRVIPGDAVQREADEVWRAMRAGGHPMADRIDHTPAACSVLVESMHDIAVEHDIDGYETTSALLPNGDLEIALAFTDSANALCFRMLLA